MVLSTKNNTKVTPIDDAKAPATKQNNFFEKEKDFVQNFKTILSVEALLGINRLYLFGYGNVTLRFYYFYVTFLFAFIIYFMIVGDITDGSYTMFRETVSLEYLLLIFSSLTNKNKLKSFFQNLASFDEMLNIRKEIYQSVPVYKIIFWIIISIVYSLCEYIIYHYTLDGNFKDLPMIIVYMALFIHDCEQLFFCNLIKTITFRLKVLKAHIQREFKAKKGMIYEKTESNALDKIEILSNNTYLDTSALHRAYELLHSCIDELNSVMSFPMIVMLFSSGLNTTLLMKRFFQITQLPERTKVDDATLVYASVRSLRFTILVIVPCYYASLTSRQVTTIRSTLHNAINTFKLDKIERRKTKAFFQLTQDSEFVFTLWGVIRLSMSLPLSYASLCTTYLVIFIQFSKFID